MLHSGIGRGALAGGGDASATGTMVPVHARPTLTDAPRGMACALCGGDMDRQAYHAQACRRGSATRTPRHHCVQHAVQATLRWAGCAVTRGQEVPGLPGHIPDLAIRGECEFCQLKVLGRVARGASDINVTGVSNIRKLKV